MFSIKTMINSFGGRVNGVKRGKTWFEKELMTKGALSGTGGDKKGVKRGRNDDKGGRNVAALVIVTYSDPLDSCFCLILHLYLSPHHQPKTR